MAEHDEARARDIVVRVPERVSRAEPLDEASFAQELRMLAAVKLYELWVICPLGMMLLAKQEGLMRSLAPMLDRLDEAGMWISQQIRDRTLVFSGD